MRENVHDEVRSVRPSLVNDDLVRKVNERVCDDKRFTISDLSLHFPQISRTLVFFIYLFYIYIYLYISLHAPLPWSNTPCIVYSFTCCFSLYYIHLISYFPYIVLWSLSQIIVSINSLKFL